MIIWLFLLCVLLFWSLVHSTISGKKNVLFEFVHTRVKCVIACQMFMVTVYGSKTVAVESVVGLDDNELDC